MHDHELLKTGLQHYQRGNRDEAEKCFRKVVNNDKNNVAGLNMLGMVYVNTGRPSEAVQIIGRALDIKPHDHQAWANLGLAYQQLSDFLAAEKSLKKSLEIKPENPAILDSLGSVSAEQGNYSEAVIHYERALRINGHYPQCWINLSKALVGQRKYEKALQAISQAIKIDQKMPMAFLQLAEVLRKQSRFKDAIQNYQQVISLDNSMPDALLGLATTYRLIDEPEPALKLLNKAANQFPDYAPVFASLGILQEQMGDKEAAASSFKQAIHLAPDVIAPYYQLSQIKGRKTTVDELQAMELLLEKNEYFDDDKVHLYFALADAYDQRQASEQAFDFWRQANEVRAAQSPYDPEERIKRRNTVLKFSGGLKNKIITSGEDTNSARMVFIVGMPRSGTSLTDQVVASHSQVSSLGEVSYAEDMSNNVKALTGSIYPEGLAALSESDYQFLRQSFIEKIPQKFSGSAIVLDKTPMNFQYLGLLAEVFPRAQFIHCHRNPVGNCFSIYKLPFSVDQDYAHDLAALGHHYKVYWEMMQSWQEMYPNRILNVCYEDTVDDLELQARRLTEFLGLDFESEILNFYQSERVVRTPSASQVRQPIYKDSVQAWQKYEKYLGPLIETLKP